MKPHTSSYFDTHLHDYSPKRLRFALSFLKKHAQPGQSLIDIGCGTGNILKILRQQTALTLFGLDASASCLCKAEDVSGCIPIHGSITDDVKVDSIEGFDFAILAAVLHHVIGPTRRASKALAEKALVNSLRLLKPGGRLIIVEPTFSPCAMMWAVFWLKRFTTAVTSQPVT